jgi:hypothetical protein
MPAWQLDFRPSPTLPALAWLLRARPPRAELSFGSLVRCTPAGIVEGTWLGEGGPHAPLCTTTLFGSAVIADGPALYVVPPGHMLEGVYVAQQPAGLVATNSLAALLVASGLELDPALAYPPLFNESVRGLARTRIPTTGAPISAWFFDRLRLDLDGRLSVVAKPAEAPFADFADYRRRLANGLASALANMPTASEMVVTISSGYDGAAVAALAAEQGCRLALTVDEGKPVPGSADLADSGADIGRRLGMAVTTIGRLDYQGRDDRPEAEFLATGFTGEDVVLGGGEPMLHGRLLLTGFYGDGMWWRHRPPRPRLWRSDQSGSSLGEWRLRAGFVHLPLACVGAIHQPLVQRISGSAEMRPWFVGGRYDKPIPRRIVEEAGLPRGSFGVVKRAASATIHVDGPAALAPASAAALARFAAAEGRPLHFPRRPPPPLWRRGLLRAARRARLEALAFRLEQHKLERGVHDARFGSLLLRWAIDAVRPRYAELDPTAPARLTSPEASAGQPSRAPP